MRQRERLASNSQSDRVSPELHNRTDDWRKMESVGRKESPKGAYLVQAVLAWGLRRKYSDRPIVYPLLAVPLQSS